MATKDTSGGTWEVSRRDFLKATAATAVAGCALDFAYDPEKAAAYEAAGSGYTVTTTTCPYCSASCGQRVVVKNTDPKTVVDIYGDFESPMNSGGLCAKGAGAYQLVTNKRRLGAYAGTHPQKNMDGTSASPFFTQVDGSGNPTEVAYKRTGNGNWSSMDLTLALDEIATKLVADRNADTANFAPASDKYNTKGVAFFGSSHINNEPNYVYRKLIADFGTSMVEHQARI